MFSGHQPLNLKSHFFAEREKNLKFALLSKTLKCADPNLTLPHEAILGKRHTAGLLGGGGERSRW